MTIDDFDYAISSGKQYVLLDNYVVDVKNFIDEHPGGSAVLKHHIGKDIGKYFHGAYSVVSPYAQNIHSTDALKILKRLIVSKLSSENHETYFIKDSMNNASQLYSIKDQEEIGKDLYRVTLSNPQTRVKNIVDYSLNFGKCFLVCSKENNKRRYYTVCHCLWSGIYNEYLTVIKAVVNNQEYEPKYSSIDEYKAESKDLELVVKHYGQSNNGISKQLTQPGINSKFFIEGPLSKGIKIGEDCNYFIWVGTGILPFIDIFAYVARKFLYDKNPQKAIFQDESFESYPEDATFIIEAFFESREKAPGIELLELIDKMFNGGDGQDIKDINPEGNQRKKIFTINVNYKDQGFFPLKIRKEFFINILKENEGEISSVNVCGSPSFNEIFDLNIQEICQETRILSNKFRII